MTVFPPAAGGDPRFPDEIHSPETSPSVWRIRICLKIIALKGKLNLLGKFDRASL